jgi:hypothetical protein
MKTTEAPTYEELEEEICKLKAQVALLKRANKGLGSNLAWRVYKLLRGKISL